MAESLSTELDDPVDRFSTNFSFFTGKFEFFPYTFLVLKCQNIF